MDTESFVKGVAIGATVTGLAAYFLKSGDTEKVVKELPEVTEKVVVMLTDSDPKKAEEYERTKASLPKDVF